MRTICAVLLCGLLAMPAVAQALPDDIKENCTRYRNDVKEREDAQRWKRVADLAAGVAEQYCGASLPPDKLPVALFEFLTESSRELESMGIDEKIFPFRAQLPKVKAIVDAERGIPNMAMLPPGLATGVSFEGSVRVSDVPACDRVVGAAREAKRVAAQSCRQLLESLHASYEPLQLLVQRAYTKEVKQYLDGLQLQWDDFLTRSRAQTALELAVNSYFWRKDKTSGMFLEPPTWQLVLLHPSVVLEYVDKALDGNRSEEGLMLEVVGANWWRSKSWYVPTGASYVLVYSDRAGLPDWANGVAVYFDSKYVLGATRRDGNTGYFISVDLLELYKDKKKTLDKYTRNLPAPK
jgi:hypothetical protein